MAARARGLVELRYRHRVTGLSRTAGSVDTVSGDLLAPDEVQRGAASSREVVGAFEFRAQAVIVTSGGIGGNDDLVRRNWPERLGNPPRRMIAGVPAYVDGHMSTGYDYSWFVLTQKIIEKEFALSGSEQNPDLTGKSVRGVLGRLRPGPPGPVEAFRQHGVDFVVERDLDSLVRGMNALTDEPLIDEAELRREIVARDRETVNKFSKDLQINAIRAAGNYLGDKLGKVAPLHRLLDPKAGPLIAVRLNIITRKSLGGLETDLSSRVLTGTGEPVPGVYAAGEVAGFGGGGVHGYRSLEGTFLGGCLLSGRAAGRAAARAVG